MTQVVLVVDDSKLIRHIVCHHLEERGFDVISATNGVEVMELLDIVTPTVIVTDLEMPKMDGGQLINRIKADPRTAGIPIVILSGSDRSTLTSDIPQCDYIIFKELNIAHQLECAMRALLPSGGESHSRQEHANAGPALP